MAAIAEDIDDGLVPHLESPAAASTDAQNTEIVIEQP